MDVLSEELKFTLEHGQDVGKYFRELSLALGNQLARSLNVLPD